MNRVLAALLIATIAACDGPTAPPRTLALSYDGAPERGRVILLSAQADGAPATGVEWTATPAAAVDWRGAGVAQLLAAGSVTFSATAAAATGAVVVEVAVPPSIVFASVQNQNRDIWRIALDGGDVLRLTEDGAEELAPTATAGRVYFLSTRVFPAAVYSVPAGGGDVVRETTVAAAYADPAISPDGTRLAFVRVVGGVSKVHVSDRSGANARQLTTSGPGVIEASPAWKPDGSEIAFVTTASGNADIRIVPLAGGAGTPIAVSSAPEVEPAWSPDGGRIAFTRGNSGGADLFEVDVATGAVTRLTDRPGSAARATWLADGRIVFTRTDQNITRLHWLDPAAPDSLHPIPFDSIVTGRPTALR